MPKVSIKYHVLSIKGFAKHTLYKIHNTKYRKTTGFTLIEILIVISIIAVLVSAGFFNYSAARARGRDAQRKKDLQAIKSALLLYWQDQRKFPGEDGQTYASDDTNAWIKGLTPDYIANLPQDPIQTNPASGSCASKQNVYCYTVRDDQNFVLWAQMENKKDKEIIGKPGSTCKESSLDSKSNFNYCLTSPQ